MARKSKSNQVNRPATKRDIDRLRREIGDGFEQVVMNLTAALKLMQKEARRRRATR